MKNPLFYAKILLFGEYGIIENSNGLTIPYNFYQGTLRFDEGDQAFQSNEKMRTYADYLENCLGHIIDIAKLQRDLENGLWFDSNIPQGYGVGSSGALVAAIYDRYALDKIAPGGEGFEQNEIPKLKRIFGEMESFFHGKSSGIDPLICYLNLPLFIESKDEIRAVGLPKTNDQAAIFLINSGKPGETAPMVQLFFEKLKNEGFRKTLKDEFIKYNNACIDAFLKRDINPFFSNLKELSTWAFLHFKPMIPKPLLKAWEHGIHSNDYYLKLCGSGGGGYVLGFTRDLAKARAQLKDFELEIIHRF